MKIVKAIGINILLFILLYSIIGLGYTLLSSIHLSLGILFSIVALIIFAIVNHRIHKEKLLFKKPLIATLSISAPALFTYIFAGGNLLIALVVIGGSTSFSYDTYPPESAIHNGDWKYALLIASDSRKAFWEEDGLEYLTLSIQDREDNKLFKEKYRVVLSNFKREVVWDTLSEIRVNIQDIPFDRVGSTGNWELIYKDTVDILEMVLKFNENENLFEVDTAVFNEAVMR